MRIHLLALSFIYDVIIFVRALLSPFFFFFFYFQVTTNRPIPPTTTAQPPTAPCTTKAAFRPRRQTRSGRPTTA